MSIYLFWTVFKRQCGLTRLNFVNSIRSQIYVIQNLSNKISFMKTIVSLCCFSEMFNVQGQNLHFFFTNIKSDNVLLSCIGVSLFFENARICISLQNSQWQEFGNTQEDKMFLSRVLSVKLACIYFLWFSKHRWCFAFDSHQ